MAVSAGCGMKFESSVTTGPEPREAPRTAPGVRNGPIRVALLPTVVSGVNPASGPAWSEAFQRALAQDPRVSFADSKAVEKTVEDHRKGKFNAFKNVTADVWIETGAYTLDQAAKSNLTGKIQNVPQVHFKARLRKNLDDRAGFDGADDAGKLLPTDKAAAASKDVDEELVSRVAGMVRAAFDRLP